MPTGTPLFGSFGGGPDVINLSNLNVHLAIPVVHKAGRGTNFTYDLSYDNSVWYPIGSGSSKVWQPVQNWGWRGVTEIATGYVSYSSQQSGCMGDDGWETYTIYFNYAYHDPFGVIHGFENLIILVGADKWGCSGLFRGGTDTAVDGSGYTISARAASATVTSVSGRVFVPPLNSSSGSASSTDRNGNQISVNGSGVFTDTLGTIALTVAGVAPSPTTFTYTAPSGANAAFTMKYTTYTVQTNFGCSGINEYGANGTTQISLVSEIDLPDGSKYSLSYEATPQHSGHVTGRIAAVTLPTGGTISYTYTGGSNGVTCADGSAAGLSRQTSDGTWTYARTAGTGAAYTTTVTDPVTPQGNQTVIQFQGLYETQRKMYQGSSNGTLLETLNTCYNGNTSNCSTTAVALPITQRNITTVLASGKQSEHDDFWNTYGGPTEADDYDYGAAPHGASLKKTLATYASLGSITAFRQTVTIQNGSGSTVSKVNYNYDETGVTPTSGTPQHVTVSGPRGNLTSVNNYTGSTTFLTKSSTYYDTGTLATTTDVNNGLTTYNYASGAGRCPEFC
jgi:hypothetical protein